MAGSWFGKIRNLSGNPNRLKLLVQLLLNVLSQFGHTQRSIRIAIAHTLVLYDDIGGAESLQDACASFEFQRSHIPSAHAMGDHPSATPSMIREPKLCPPWLGRAIDKKIVPLPLSGDTTSHGLFFGCRIHRHQFERCLFRH